MSSRDAILQRIRTELARPGAGGADPPPVPEVWPRTDPPKQELVERFSEALGAVHGELIRCGSMDEARRELAGLLEELDQGSLREEEGRESGSWLYRNPVGAMDRPLCREVAAGALPRGILWEEPGEGPQSMAKLSAGLMAAEWLFADTGSCVVCCATAYERLLCYLPPVCIVVARVEQLAEHLPAAWEEIARQTADPTRRGEFVFVTGPSRTADIEKILILGVHGPKRLIVILVG